MVAKCAPAKGVDTKRAQNYNAKKAITKFKKHTAHLFLELNFKTFLGPDLWIPCYSRGYSRPLVSDSPTRQAPSLAAALFCRWTLVSMLYAKL